MVSRNFTVNTIKTLRLFSSCGENNCRVGYAGNLAFTSFVLMLRNYLNPIAEKSQTNT